MMHDLPTPEARTTLMASSGRGRRRRTMMRDLTMPEAATTSTASSGRGIRQWRGGEDSEGRETCIALWRDVLG
jgi:hypothetical protein